MSLLAYKLIALVAAGLLIATKSWTVCDSILSDRYQPRTFILQLALLTVLIAIVWHQACPVKEGESLLHHVWHSGLWVQTSPTDPLSSYSSFVAALFGVLSVFVLGHTLGWTLIGLRKALLALR